MAAPKGNQFASKAKIWSDLIRKEFTQNPERMRRIVDRLLTEAEDGNMTAIREIGDRLEGKPLQQVEATGANGSPLIVQIVKLADVDDSAAGE